MPSGLVNPRKYLPWFRVVFIALLLLLLSGWTTCSGMFVFSSCPSQVPVPQIISVAPGSMPGNLDSVVLSVTGADFVSQSQILWNGNALETTFTDSRHLTTTITQQILESFGGSPGNGVSISVRSQGANQDFGCANGGTSATLILMIT
jgi:hypothetical protein